MDVIETYLTLDGRVLDLRGLPAEHQRFLDRVLELYRARAPHAQADSLIHSMENPLLVPTHGVVTREVYGHPLYIAVRDLVDRLGILQGELGAAPGDDAGQDPAADEWLTVSEAAELKGVTVPGLHEAIRRGDVLAKPKVKGSKYLVVSRFSLEAYQPSAVRQRAGSQRRQQD